MVIQLSNPVEYTGEGVEGRGSLDEKGVAYWSRIEAYQRVRTIILRDVWLIDNDHKEDEEEGASETGPDEGAPDAASTAEQNSRPHKPSNHGCGDNGSS